MAKRSGANRNGGAQTVNGMGGSRRGGGGSRRTVGAQTINGMGGGGSRTSTPPS